MKQKLLAPQDQKLLQQAYAVHQAGRLEEAIAFFSQLHQHYPENPQILTGLGTIALQLGMVEPGVLFLEKSLEIDPEQPMALSNMGTGLEQLNRFDAALSCYDRSIALSPNSAGAYINRGIALQALGQPNEALQSYDRAIVLNPDLTEAYNNRGNVLKELRRYEDALASYDQAIMLNPEYASAHGNRGIVLHELKRLDEALLSYDRAIALKPDFVKVHSNRGVLLKDLGRAGDALASFDRAIELSPRFAEAHNNRGNLFKELRMNEEALACYERATELNPSYAEAYVNRGKVLHDLLRLDEALACFDHAIDQNPRSAEAFNDRGNLKKDLMQLDAASADYEQAILLDPDYPTAHWNQAFLSILTGDYAEGWKLYEWRWKDTQKGNVREFSQPLWLGDEPLAGKTLLIYPEQGFGDFIQFCRYAPMVAALGARVILETPAALSSLASTLAGDITVVEKGSPLPPFDYQCPIMSLPLAFKTTLATVPATVPYLHADTEKQRLWQQRLGNKTAPRIGLVWSGRPEHKNDHNRSIPLQLLEPLLDMPVEIHVLQKDIRPEDHAILSRHPHIHLHGAALNDFSDTAALVQEMELVISVDTSVAHLAGALGKPVWILLPYAPDYRWMLERRDSPWYPTAILFRQPAIGDWAGVVNEIGQLVERIGAGHVDRVK